MGDYPIFVDLRGRRCVVVGGGTVGTGKVRGLCEAGAHVTVVDPAPGPELRQSLHVAPSDDAGALAMHAANIALELRPFRPEDLDGCVLAFACTGDAAVNEGVARAAAGRKILFCQAGASRDVPNTDLSGAGAQPRATCGEGHDAARATTFRTGAVLRRGEVCVAVSTGGASPGLATTIRDRIANGLGPEIAEAATMLAGLRERLRSVSADPDARANALRDVLDGGFPGLLLDLLRNGRRSEAVARCEAAVTAARDEAAAGTRGSRCTS